MKQLWKFVKCHWQVITVTLFGALLRFYRLRDLTTFGGDQGVDYQFVAQMIVSGRPRLLGPITHVGVFLGPLYYYLLVPFFILFRFDPIAAPFFFALIGSLTVGFVYILAKKFLPNTLAFLVSLLYASSPVIMESSRAPSQPDLMPFLSILFLISILRIFERKAQRRDGIILGIVLGSAIQFHYLTFPIYIFFVIAAGWLWFRRKEDRANFSWLIASVFCCSFLLLSPWFLFEIRNQFFISKQIFSFLGTGEIAANPAGILLRFLDLSWFSVSRLIGVGSQFLTICILITMTAGIFSEWRNSKYRLLLLYTVLNLFGIALYQNPLENHYIASIYPSLVLLASLGVASVFSKRVALVILIALSLVNLFHYNPFRNNGYTMPKELNTTVIQKISKIISDDVSSPYYEVANVLDGDTRAQPYRYMLTYVFGKKPMGVEEYALADTLYVIAHTGDQVTSHTEWEIASLISSRVEKQWDITASISLYRLRRIRQP